MRWTGAALAAATLLAALAAAGTARAEPRPYRGPHPVDYEGHWHFERDVHVHDGLAVGTAPFAAVEGVLVFLGDPVDFAYEGDVWTYRGAHPLPFGMKGYCGISGEHDHPFAPEGEYRRHDGGVYDYVGAMRGGVGIYRPGRTEVPRSVRDAREERAERATPAVYYGFTPVPVHPTAHHGGRHHGHGEHGHGEHGDAGDGHARHGHGDPHGRAQPHHGHGQRRWRIREPQCTALTNSRAVVFDGCGPTMRGTPRNEPRHEPRTHRDPPVRDRRERSQGADRR